MQSRGRSENTTKVFVGSLPAGVTPDDLRKLFEPYGAIAECDISNGCGFLHLEDKDLATKAITELNGTEFMGGRISVERGRIKPRRGNGPMRGNRDRGGPYPRGGGRDFRGPPRGPGGFGGRDRFNGPPSRGGFGGPPRRGGFDDRRPNNSVPVPYSGDRGYDGGYGAPPAGNFSDRGGYGDGPRGGYDDRRGAPPPRASGAPDLFTRRDTGPKPMGGSYDNSRYGGNSNGYGPAGGYAAGPPPSFNAGMQGGAYGTSYGNNVASAGGYGDNRDTYGAPVAPTGYNQGPASYDTTNYGAVQGSRGGGYDVGYPPLPAQRGYGSGSGGPGPRGGAPGRRF
ncbi:uncharacterized protein LOC143201489 isoform X2 [Rhynchophorus ferrugineus]|uniref:RRM domain-containing protein n=1 Tax=Rhynchophorus ferrugineus TaxID=354439 RepID=A0A834HSC5_RHYFE|nr:hypothetical protein GWI33_021787 [Rhynchophorus ferrugineus]KAF7264988.1 hypothetical protein GWI33_021782 [Rhynchophorus ferrugineus]